MRSEENSLFSQTSRIPDRHWTTWVVGNRPLHDHATVHFEKMTADGKFQVIDVGKDDVAVVIRPDMYIGYAGSLRGAEIYLEGVFLDQRE